MKGQVLAAIVIILAGFIILLGINAITFTPALTTFQNITVNESRNASQVQAANVTNGTFGANVGRGAYAFPENLTINDTLFGDNSLLKLQVNDASPTFSMSIDDTGTQQFGTGMNEIQFMTTQGVNLTNLLGGVIVRFSDTTLTAVPSVEFATDRLNVNQPLSVLGGDILIDATGTSGVIEPKRTLHMISGFNPGFIVNHTAGRSYGLFSGTTAVAFDFDSDGFLTFRQNSKSNIDNGATSGSTRVLSLVGSGIAMGTCVDPDHDLNIGGTGAGCNTGTWSEIDAGQSTFTVSSSSEIKENFSPVSVPNILSEISNIGVFTYDFKDYNETIIEIDEITNITYENNITHLGAKDRIGFKAEDFAPIFGRSNGTSLSGDEIMYAMWLGIQELIAENELLKERVSILESK